MTSGLAVPYLVKAPVVQLAFVIVAPLLAPKVKATESCPLEGVMVVMVGGSGIFPGITPDEAEEIGPHPCALRARAVNV